MSTTRIQKKVLVLGGSGFVGRPFCKYLEGRGHSVTNFDIRQDVAEDARTHRFNFEPYDEIYVLAWDVGGSKYLYRRDSQFKQLDWNIALLANLMPQLASCGRPFLFVSSQLAEEAETVYGITKRLGETWAHLIGGKRVRLWNVYGGLEDISDRSHVISDLLSQAILNGEIKMLTTGEEVRQFIYIDDVCKAFEGALADPAANGVYDVTSFEWTSIKRVATIIAEKTNARLVVGNKVGSTPVTPIRGRLPGWWPMVGIEEGLDKMILKFKDGANTRR